MTIFLLDKQRCKKKRPKINGGCCRLRRWGAGTSESDAIRRHASLEGCCGDRLDNGADIREKPDPGAEAFGQSAMLSLSSHKRERQRQCCQTTVPAWKVSSLCFLDRAVYSTDLSLSSLHLAACCKDHATSVAMRFSLNIHPPTRLVRCRVSPHSEIRSVAKLCEQRATVHRDQSPTRSHN